MGSAARGHFSAVPSLSSLSYPESLLLRTARAPPMCTPTRLGGPSGEEAVSYPLVSGSLAQSLEAPRRGGREGTGKRGRRERGQQKGGGAT